VIFRSVRARVRVIGVGVGATCLGCAGLLTGLVLADVPSGAAVSQAGGGPSGPGRTGVQVSRLFTPAGLETDQGHALTKPDDIVSFGHDLFVAFQNGVGSMGEPAPDGNTQSSLLELTRSGGVVAGRFGFSFI